MDRELNHKLKKLLCKQLEGYADIQNVGGKALEDIANMVKTVKNLDIIEKNGQDGSSYGGYYMGSYDDGMSTRRGRDAMGRYVSRDDGAMHDEINSMRDQLRAMMEKLDTMR